MAGSLGFDGQGGGPAGRRALQAPPAASRGQEGQGQVQRPPFARLASQASAATGTPGGSLQQPAGLGTLWLAANTQPAPGSSQVSAGPASAFSTHVDRGGAGSWCWGHHTTNAER